MYINIVSWHEGTIAPIQNSSHVAEKPFG